MIGKVPTAINDETSEESPGMLHAIRKRIAVEEICSDARVKESAKQLGGVIARSGGLAEIVRKADKDMEAEFPLLEDGGLSARRDAMRAVTRFLAWLWTYPEGGAYDAVARPVETALKLYAIRSNDEDTYLILVRTLKDAVSLAQRSANGGES